MVRLFFLPLLLLSSELAFAAGPEPKVFRARLPEDLGTLDWNYGEVNPEIVYQLMEGLFRADHKGQPQLAAARSYKWNADKTELSVQLKRDRRWSDGSPLCAQQFVDSWTRLRSKELSSLYAHYAHILRFQEAKSCRDLVVRFTRPAPEALALLSHYVFFPVRLDNLARSPKAFKEGTSLLVNGPFRVTEWKTNTSLTLAPNLFYQAAKPLLDKVEFLFIPEDSTAKSMFDQKQLDWVRDVSHLLRSPALEKTPEFRVFPSLTVYYFGLNASRSKWLQDPDIRSALAAALDLREIPKVLGGENRGLRTWLVPEVFPALKAPPVVKPSAEASERLKEAVKKGTMDLVLRVYSKSAHRTLAEWAQGQWEKKLGVRIPLEVQEGKVYWQEIAVKPAPIFLSGVTAPFGHPRAFLQEFLSTSTANWTGWSAPEFDKAVAEENFQLAENILERDAFVIPLYQRDTVALVQKKWRDFYINPLGQVFLSELR